MLVHYAMTLNLSPEAMKACSQNLGHAEVMTTFTSYGQVPTHRQGELIRDLGERPLDGSGRTNREQVVVLEEILASLKTRAPVVLQTTQI